MDDHRSFPVQLSPPSVTSFTTTASNPLHAPSIWSVSSDSTGSTVPGLGALSGKAVLALGRMTLQGVEYVAIRRRLAAISSHFPHMNDTPAKDIERMYDDLLEFSRHGLYPQTIRQQALELILSQIGRRHVLYLRKALAKWPAVEMRLFLSTFMCCIDPQWEELRPDNVRQLQKVYSDSLSPWEHHSSVPFFDFVGMVAELDETSCLAVLEGGFLDILLYLYSTDFRDPLAPTDSGTDPDYNRNTNLSTSCHTFLNSCSRYKQCLNFLCNHPIQILWSTCPPLPFTKLVEDRLNKRYSTWLMLPRELAKQRIRSIFRLMSDLTQTHDETRLLDICTDLLEFACSDNLDEETCGRALRTLHRCIVRGTQMVKDAIREVIVQASQSRIVLLLTRLIQRLSPLAMNPGSSTYFFVPSDGDDFKINAISHFLHCFCSISRGDGLCMDVLLKSNILGLLRPLMKEELQDPHSLSQETHPTYYHPSDSALIEQIRENGLAPYLRTGTEDFEYRRMVLCQAFDVFLCRNVSHPFPMLLSLDVGLFVYGQEDLW